MTLTKTAGRTCGPCSACCTTAQVLELKKPSGARCSLLTDSDKPACGSCSIYATRPNACAVYRCSWLDGYGLDSQRPDLCGIVFELADCPKGTPFVAIGLTAPGFLPHNRSVRETVRWWLAQGLAVTHDRNVHGTPEQLATLSNCIFQFADGVQVRVGGS